MSRASSRPHAGRAAGRAGLRRRRGRHRGERQLHARRPADDAELSRRATASRCWHRCREADRMQVYGIELRSRLFLGTAQYPSPAILARAVEAAAAEVVTVSLRRESGAAPGRAGVLVDHPASGRAGAAQHRRLPHGQGGGHHRPDGARAVRHALDQARGDRRPRHAAARRVRLGRGRAHPGGRMASRCSPTPPRT